MITATALKTRVLAALSLCAVLACGTAMANDSFEETMRDAVARNDSQFLTDTGGPSFIARAPAPAAVPQNAYRATMRDALIRNDTQLLPESFSGGATFFGGSAGALNAQDQYLQTMREAIRHHDSQLLPDSYAGGADFLY